jgi:hypothetical protein
MVVLLELMYMLIIMATYLFNLMVYLFVMIKMTYLLRNL